MAMKSKMATKKKMAYGKKTKMAMKGGKKTKMAMKGGKKTKMAMKGGKKTKMATRPKHCLLYTSPSPRDRTRSRMPSSA